MNAPILSLEGIRKRYSSGPVSFEAVRGITLAVHEGEYVAITGPSGSGKSTLMNIIGCLDTPTAGTYRLAGTDVSAMSETELALVRNEQIGFVFQQFHLLPTLTAWRNVELPLLYAGIAPKVRKKRAIEALGRVGLGDRVDNRPGQLSGGQQQRVAVARALVSQPSMILADEPTGNLDSTSTKDVLGLLAELHASGATIVLITHEAEVAAAADRTVQLADGLITADSHSMALGGVA